MNDFETAKRQVNWVLTAMNGADKDAIYTSLCREWTTNGQQLTPDAEKSLMGLASTASKGGTVRFG